MGLKVFPQAWTLNTSIGYALRVLGGVDGEPMELASPGFSVYLTISWPSPQGFTRLLRSLEPCVDFLELGLPSRSPIYDGPTIRMTHREASSHTGPWEAMKLLAEARPSRPFIVMAYMHEHPLDRLLGEASRAGASSVLLPDLPFEYPDMIEGYVDASRRMGLEPSLFASPKFPHRMLEIYGRHKPLLVYLGLQPATGVRLPARMLENIGLARRLVGDTYLLAGFSISSGDQARQVLEAGASGVVVGSHIARVAMARGIEAAAKEACRIYEAVHGGG